MHIFGYSAPASILKWIELDQLYGVNKDIDQRALVNYLARWGHSPFAYEDLDPNLWGEGEMDIEAAFNVIFAGLQGTPTVTMRRHLIMLFDIIFKAFMLKLWVATRQACSIQDFVFETSYSVFHRSIPDKTIETAFEILHNKWATGQLNVPTGSMASKFTLKYLPLTSDLGHGYRVYDSQYYVQHDSVEYTGWPAVVFNELRFGAVQGNIGTLQANHIHFVDIKLLNSATDQEIVMYNRLTGEFDGLSSAQEHDSAVRVGIVYPHNFKRLKPISRGLKFEKRHWPLIFSYPIVREPIITVQFWTEWEQCNQKSWVGPKDYLITLRHLMVGDLMPFKFNIKAVLAGLAQLDALAVLYHNTFPKCVNPVLTDENETRVAAAKLKKHKKAQATEDEAKGDDTSE